MRSRSSVRVYCEAVFVLGCLSVLLFADDANFGYVLHSPITFVVLAAGVTLGEMLPIKIPRRGEDEELTLSTSFGLALLLVGGLGPALIAQGVASIIQDVASHKPFWRQRFNIGQYTLSMVAADVPIRLLDAGHHLVAAHPWASGQLPAIMVGSGAFFIVNTGLVGIAVALYQEAPIVRYFRNDLGFVFGTLGVMVLISPIVLAATAYSVAIVPLCLAPVLAMYNTVSRGARSEHAARHDALTGLPNRAAFHEAVAEAVADDRVPAGIVLMDLDRFKEVNDTLGHRYGDLLLRLVADRFRGAIGTDGHIARLGGDEFAVVCPGRGLEDTLELAERLGGALSGTFELEEMVIDVQASVGIALFPDHGCDVEALLQKADVAMYRAKETRSGMALYEERHDHHSPARLALTAELRTAVATEEIVVWYQPELDLRTGEVTAVEALVRWDHPGAGVLAPSAFIRLAEQANLIKPLTHRVMRVALAQIAEWRAHGLDLTVAVNISPQVLVDRSFTAFVIAALDDAGVPPARLKLEVTEGALMADPVTARTVLQELERLGIEIAIDDFGTGYSSLAYLADLPVSEVKIDRSFVSRMAVGSGERIIVNSTIDLAHHLGLRAIAEGVHDLALLPTLKLLGCDAAQGYAISRPLVGADFVRWLSEFEGAAVAGLRLRERAPEPFVGQAA